jgi:hypothetical protein
MEPHWIVFGSADALTTFAADASQAGIEVERLDVQTFSAEQTAMECLRLALSGTAAFALASVIKAYLAAKPSRRVTITKIESDSVITVDARQLSKRELLELLPKCRDLVLEGEDKARSATITDLQWQRFLQYARSRLLNQKEFFVAPETLAEACSFQAGFWEQLEALWRAARPTDFDYRGQHQTISGEPSMIHFWRTTPNAN